MDEQNLGRGRGQRGGPDFMKDIEEAHYGSTSEDDDDEPRLRIDTSEDEADCSAPDNSLSSSSFPRRRKPPITFKLKNHSGVASGGRGAGKFDAKNTNPLQSLQQLVHSPFLNAQISAADGGVNQGCKINPLVRENRSKPNCDNRYSPDSSQATLAAAAEAIRNILSSNNNGGNIGSSNNNNISNIGAINSFDVLPRPKSSNSSNGAKSRKSSNAAAKRNNTNFQRLSPVSIEVVPSLSHLLPLSQHSPPSPQTPQQPFADKCDTSSSSYNNNNNNSHSSGSSGRTLNSNRLNYIVNKLQRSATEEEHLRQLQQLQSSPEAENFKMFQQFLKSGQFQARCNNNNLEILPATSAGTVTAAAASNPSNMINLTNSKGFRYASSNPQPKSTFGNLSTNSFPMGPLPPPPPLTFKSSSGPEFGNTIAATASKMDFRMPPTLTVIPKSSGGGKKANCRRSPPPMVPIESIANFRKPLNEDNVVYRLKKLGTDIELEKNTAAASLSSSFQQDDYCGAASMEDATVRTAATTASVTNASYSSNNSDKVSLPFLKPIPIAERSHNDIKNNAMLSKLHPPPPSLIPIKPPTQFVPIVQSVPQQSTISEVPIKMKKSSGNRRMPSFVSIMPKMNVNQNDVLDMAARIRMNSGIGPGSGPNDTMLPRKEDFVGNVPILMSGQPALDFSHVRNSLPNKVTKRKKRNRLTTKSEYTRLAHALVQAATPLPQPKKDDIDRPVLVPIRNESPPKELDLRDVEREIITIEPILIPPSRRESEEDEDDVDIPNDLAPYQAERFVNVPDDSESAAMMTQPPPPLPPPLTPAPSSSDYQNGGETVIDEKECFLFNPSQAIQVGLLPNGRKMLSCDICSGVYHKMFSLKKHYYRNHINPKFISAKHAEMFKVSPISAALSNNPKFNSSMYWCSICECLFNEKHELSSHLTDHPPLTLDNSNRTSSRLYVCPTCNTVFSKKRTQVRHSKKCAKSHKSTDSVTATSGSAAADTIKPVPTIKVDSPKSVDDALDDNAAEETNSTTSSKNNDDVAELDDMPTSKSTKSAGMSMMCLFCELSFTDTTKRKKHVLQHHHPKRKHQPCVYCKNKTFSDLSDLLKHICEMHSKRYFGCAICKIRFRTKEDLVAHNAESHDGDIADIDKEPIIEEKPKPTTISNKNGKNYKCNQCTKVFINTVELGRHRKSAHRDSSRNNIKKVVSAFSVPNDSNDQQKYRSTIITTADYETEFYRNVSHNVKNNLENFMEGRIEMRKEDNPPEDANDPRYADLPGGIEGAKEKTESLSFQDMYGTENIDSRFIQNVSRLHLATQLTMLRKANLLDKELDCPLRSSAAAKPPNVSRNSAIASHLALAEKSDGERADDEAKNENDAANEIVFTGEWIRARNYICGTCFARFNNFWDMEDHRWSRHPNVYGFYYEFVTEQSPGSNWAMKRMLQNNGALGLPIKHSVPASSTCTKCQKSFTPVSEFHKHILECGGDTTWMSMMFAAHTKRNKKYRPYGSRRRKNVARHRGLKRNIPTTPVKIIGPPRNRQKAGDTETIQRMIANLPPKRITRRVITFDDVEVKPKGRVNKDSSSQSNILTRKRKESLDVKSTASSTRSQQQNETKDVTSSKTLLGTKNNTPYNNEATAISRSRHEQNKTNSASSNVHLDSKSAPVPEEIKSSQNNSRSESAPETRSATAVKSASSGIKNKPVQSETETIKVESSAEPEIIAIKSLSSKNTKTTKTAQAKDTAAAPVTASDTPETETSKAALPLRSSRSSSRIESQTEVETSHEQAKASSSVSEEISVPTVVKITTQSKSQASANKSQTESENEPVSIRRLRASDETNSEHSESVSELKTTESISNSEICSKLELRSSSGSRKKKLIIKIQGDGKQKSSSSDQPVTIIRSDKKRKKRCTPVTSKRLAAEATPPPVPAADKQTEESDSVPEKESVAESQPIIKTENPDESPVAAENADIDAIQASVTEVKTEELGELPVASEKPVIETEPSPEPEVKTEESVDVPIISEKAASEVSNEVHDTCEKAAVETLPEVAPKKVEPPSVESVETTPEITTERIENSSSVSETIAVEPTPEVKTEKTEKLPSTSEEPIAAPIAETTTEKSEDLPTESETSVAEIATTVKTEVLQDTPALVDKLVSETRPVAPKKTKVKSAVAGTDVIVKTEIKEDPIPTASFVTTESQTEPEILSPPETVTETAASDSAASDVKPAFEEEGEIDLSTIEPAEEETPALPDTSVILAAMKETMRQTDAVISRMPIAVNSGKKRKRDDPSKCKKCGCRIETSTNSTSICESCVEVPPAKKSKPVSPPAPTSAPAPAAAPVIETFACKVCRVAVPKKVPGAEEICDKCVAQAAAANAAASATANSVTAAAAIVKTEKPTTKKCASKFKETRIVAPPPFRCRKCDSIGLAPLDGSMFCEKCSRLQETVCLLCQSSYISDTNDKVCGKCMLAGSSKQKKRTLSNNDAPAIVTSTCDNSERKPTIGQPDRVEVSCEKCGKMWKDDENSGSSICRMCRQMLENNKSPKATSSSTDPLRVPETVKGESIRCIDCSIVVVPISPEAALKKLCDGCFGRRNERRLSNEIRYLDMTNPLARCIPGIQRSPNVFSGFANATDDTVRNVEHHKEEDRHGPMIPGSAPGAASTTEQKTPMKNVKLICRGCYGVFDTVSSYKYHCDNCKHRSNEKKPLLSFAKRSSKGGAESTSQAESNNGASFEILEGVQIKYVEMAGASQSDKSEAGKETSQIPLVVYESDSSPMKKSDSSRTVKKHKRTHSSPDTIMDTIESVIRSVHSSPETVMDTIESVVKNMHSFDDSIEDVCSSLPPLADDAQSTPLNKDLSKPTPEKLEPEPTEDDGNEAGDEDDDKNKLSSKKSTSRTKSSKKKAPRKRKPTPKKSAKRSETSSAIDEGLKSETPPEEKSLVKSEPTETNQECDTADVEKQSNKRSTSPTSRQSGVSSDREVRRSSRRTHSTRNPAGRTLRSRTKFHESFSDLNPTEIEDIMNDEPEPMDVTNPSAETAPPPSSPPPPHLQPEEQQVDKPPVTPKESAKKRKRDSSKIDAKKSKTDCNNDLGFAVTKTSKTIPKNDKKNSSIDAKNFDQSDDEMESSSVLTSAKTNFASEAVLSENAILRRRSSDMSAISGLIDDWGTEYESRRNSAVTNASSADSRVGEFRSFFDESGSDCAEGNSSKYLTPYNSYDDLNVSSFPESSDGQDDSRQNSSWYTSAWNLLGRKSLGSIIDTMNEILSRPEVSSYSAESLDSFREQMLVFQDLDREMNTIDKQEEELKEDEETTTFLDLDEVAAKGHSEAKSMSGDDSFSSLNTFGLSEECDVCDQTFSEASALKDHMSTVHGHESPGKSCKYNKLKSNNKGGQNGMTSRVKHKCSHCHKVLNNKAESLMHIQEHWKSFTSNKSRSSSSGNGGNENGSLKNSIAGKLEELLLDKALMNYLKSPQESQQRNNVPLKILNQITMAKKNQFTGWKTALAQMLDMEVDSLPTSATTTASGPASPVEQAPVPVPEPKPKSKSKPAPVEKKSQESQSTETSTNTEPVDEYPCPMCNKTFQYTRLRNTHLIMVHAPRKPTLKSVTEGQNDSKRVGKNKSSNETCDNKVRPDVARKKIFRSYLLNDSVNTVLKKESSDDSLPPLKKSCSASSSSSCSTSTSTVAVGSTKNPKMSENRPVTSKSETSTIAPFSSSSISTTPTPPPPTQATATTSTSTTMPTLTPSAASESTSATTKLNPSPMTTSVAAATAKPSSNAHDHSNSRRKKPCRKKMSKKEMNLPAAIVKMKAEQALLQLCNSRFSRIIS